MRTTGNHRTQRRSGTRRVALVAAALTAGSAAAFIVPVASTAAPATPTVSSVLNNDFNTPSGATDGGQTITIKGSHFVNVKKVRFGSTRGTHLHVISSSKITVTLPSHPAGRVNVRVVSAAGTSGITSQDEFYFQVRHHLDGGDLFSCQALDRGLVRCWGYNLFGQLGDGTTTERNTPVQVAGLSDVVSVAAGSRHACALLAAGTVECWGDNTWGQLGNRDTLWPRTTPTLVRRLGKVVAISAGGLTTCALIVGGTVQCWGEGYDGQLGDNSTDDSWKPVLVQNLHNVVDLASGGRHTCATTSDGSEFCWGWNHYGQLGNGTRTESLVPVQVAGVHNAVSTALGAHTSCVVTTARRVLCWGYGAAGERGDGTATLISTHPHRVSDLRNVTMLAFGTFHGCAVVASGDELCWGANWDGQVGDGGTHNARRPTAVVGLHNVADIGEGYLHSLAVLKNDTTKAWGANYRGQLGDGTTTARHTPVTVS